MSNIVDKENCSNCGKCCMNNPLPEKFAGSTPEDTIDDSESWNLPNGNCKFLIDNGDGTYSCGNYEERPIVCRQFPQSEVEKPENCTVIL